MLTTAKSLRNCEIRARDGSIGKLKDFLVEDEHWAVRYLVIDVGSWLNGRQVLVSPTAVAGLVPGGEIAVDLTKEQIRSSPPIDTDQPVSRQHETDLHGYYGWAPYWTPYDSLGLGTVMHPVAMAPLAQATAETSASSGLPNETSGDPHLQSAHHLTGYAIEAQDGDVGHLEDFVIDDTSWKIPYALIDTTNWWPGGRVVVPTDHLTGVSWADRRVFASLTREAVKASPAYDGLSPVDDEYTARLAEYYVRRREAEKINR